MNAMLQNISAGHALSTGGIVESGTLTTQAALTADAYEIDYPLGIPPGPTAINVWAQSVLPLSLGGTICINSTDPSMDPIADTQYLTTSSTWSLLSPPPGKCLASR
ncbi:hypothetical protein EV361DRAFT_979392 [Lentinula raphanica]|nr:hypothetical protein EV361DRAFT_979392 [Lentinula raphanica]